jgi:S-adenosylmethionine uptake transporter
MRESLWMLLATFLFSVMSVCVKFAAESHSAWEMVFWRNLIGLAVLVPMIRQMEGGLIANLATPHWPAHVVRNIAGVAAVLGWFGSLAYLPLATSITLNNTSSLFIGASLYITAAWAGRKVKSAALLGTLVAGFVGIVLVLRPTLAQDQMMPALVALGSGFMASIALMSVRAMGKLGEPASRIVFYFTASGLVAGGLGMLLTGATRPTLVNLAWLVGMGVTAVGAQLALTRAYSRGRALLVANLTYASIPLASLWGWVFFNDRLPLIAWIGMAIIIAAGVAATWLTAQEEKPIAGES